jgi:hypothetical protein
VRTGRAFWGGHRLQQEEVELMGLFAALSVISVASEAISGARSLARLAGREATRANEFENIAPSLSRLDQQQHGEVEHLAATIRRGEGLSPDEQARAQSVLRRVRDESSSSSSRRIGYRGPVVNELNVLATGK